MKQKVLLLCMLLVCTVCAKAQFYVGGSLTADVISTKVDGERHTVNTYAIEPELGYRFNNVLSVGLSMGLGYASDNGSGDDVTLYGLTPYLRTTFAQVKGVSFFADWAFNYNYMETGYSGSANIYAGTLSPGVAVDLSGHWQLVARMALMQYSSTYVHSTKVLDAFQFSINNNVSLGVQYNF